MFLRTTAVAVCLLTGCLSVPPAYAQEQPEQNPPGAPPVDPYKLPIDISKLQRKFQQSVEREQREGPALRFSINVFGRAPRIQLFYPGDKLQFTPPPYGAPTHRDMINVVTPREFSVPMMDFSALIRSIPKSPKEKK